MILVQHEVIIYAEDEKAAERSLLRSEFMKNRVNLHCTYISEIPMPGDEKTGSVIDERKAPGA